MSTMNRRDFLRHSAGAVTGAAALAPGIAAAQEPLTATTVRTLGNTGIQTTLLGMGTGVQSWNGCSNLTRLGRKPALAVFEHAYAAGLRYFDLADMYGSHPLMRELLRGSFERDRIMILSKTVSREPDFIRADLERMRKELGSDYIDIVLMHCLTDRECPNWPETYRPAMDALDEAKQKGIIRAHGVSCHSLAALKEAADCPWVDVMLSRVNPFGVKMDGPVEEVVPVLQKAHAAGKGMLGMKIVGEGDLKDRITESMKFVLGLGCIDAMTIGFLAPEEVDSAIAHVAAAVAA